VAAGPATVLYLHSSSGRYGADRQLEMLIAGLDPARYRALAVLPGHGPLAGALRAAGAEVRVRPLAVLRRALFSPRGLALTAPRAAADAQALWRVGRRRGVALVHTNTSVTLGGAGTAAALGVPHVWHLREIHADHARWWPLLRRAMLTADAIPALSAAALAPLDGARQGRLITEGLPTEALKRRPAPRAEARAAVGLPVDAFVCLVVGRLNAWKGQDVLARALAEPEVARIGAIGLVAGDAWPGEPHEADLRALAARLGLGERLRLLGYRDDLDLLYGAADVVVVPSTRPEPLGLVALEAAAAGCCVVASDAGGLPEIIREGRTGRLVAPGDPAALARVLAELAADPAQRARLGAAAASDVRERFSRVRLLEQTQALYDELLGR